MADDFYADWYADRLWQLMPAIYRSLDAPVAPGTNGPLREMINRIGAQAAVVRRSIDRMGENQSIETCDDWVIPYIGELVATRLVGFLDAAAQRLDVANTIYYRRWAGTVGLLEELAGDIIGLSRGAKAAEFFRRIGRTRHQFDPPIGVVGAWTPASGVPLPIAEGLVGRYTRTPAGGFADLRSHYGADNTGTAFDEFAHTADLRAGAQTDGWYNIPNLGTFLWWLQAFPIHGAVPVSSLPPATGSPAAAPCFTFDPTGRDIPLFAPSQRTSESFGENWVSPAEWQLPVAIRHVLWKEEPEHLYPATPNAHNPGAFSVGLVAGASTLRLDRSQLSIHPERGRFSFVGNVPGDITVDYSFGFLSMIGAGGFSDGIVTELDQPVATLTVTGGSGLDAAIGAVATGVTIVIGDSLTYPVPLTTLNVPTGATVVVRAESEERPVLRSTTRTTWTINGNASSSAGGTSTVLVLQGMHVQGADIVLTGSFDSVSLRMMTLDPGTAARAGAGWDTAIDGVELAPVTLRIEGSVTNLTLERCICGPIRTRASGVTQNLSATDSIIQSIPAPRLRIEQEPIAPTHAALDFDDGTISLSRCTVLGPTRTHRLALSECVLDSLARVDDPQDGCVRFSAYVGGSNLHAPYRCVSIPARAPLFETTRYGRPGYARLRGDVDNNIIAPSAGDTILGGAQNGSEMGGYCLEQIPLLRRGFALKFEEFMPASQVPVPIDAVTRRRGGPTWEAI